MVAASGGDAWGAEYEDGGAEEHVDDNPQSKAKDWDLGDVRWVLQRYNGGTSGKRKCESSSYNTNLGHGRYGFWGFESYKNTIQNHKSNLKTNTKQTDKQ